MPSRRRSASPSPSTASPRRLRLRRRRTRGGRERRAELVGARVDDEVPDHLAQHAARDRHGRRGQHGRRRRRCGRRAGTTAGSPARAAATAAGWMPRRRATRAHDAVDEADREGQPFGSFSTPARRSAAAGRPPRRRIRRPSRRARSPGGESPGASRHGVLLGHVSRLHRLHAIRMRHDYDSTKAMISDRYRS
jgi:hypothetical protein